MAFSTSRVLCNNFILPSNRRALTTTCSRRTSTSPQRKQAVSPAVERESPRKFTDIPGPLALPMLRHSAHVLPRIGNFHHLVGLGLLEGLRDRYGDLVRLAKGSRKRAVLYVFDPEVMRQVYESGGTKAPVWERSPLQKHRQLRNSQCTVNGDESNKIWPALRAVFQDGSFLSNYDKAFDDISADATRRLGEMRHVENNLNKEIETEIYRWALETLGVLIFGDRLGCLDGNPQTNHTDHRLPHKGSLEDETLEQCSLSQRSLAECSPGERLVRCSRQVADAAYLVRSEATLKSDAQTFQDALNTFDLHFTLVEHFLSKSLAALDSGHDRPEMLLLKNLRTLNHLLLPLAGDALLAGVDVLSQTAIAMLYHLSLHAARQQRAFDELNWRTEADVDTAPPNTLPYLAACAKEALRLHPATGGVIRRTVDDIVIGGYEVPEGVDIVLAHCVSSRSENQYSRAKTFIPERWHNQGWEPVPASRAHPIATLPFGTTCPASAVVRKALESLAAKVLGKYRLEWHGPTPNLAHSGVNRLQPPYYFVFQNAS